MVPWDAVIAGVAGALLGAGGTLGGAWLTGRSQLTALGLTIAADERRAKAAEKRRVYAACMTALTTGLSALLRVQSAGNEAERAAFAFSVVAAVNAVWEVELIATAEVSSRADEVLAILGLGEEADTAGYPDALGRLTQAMRADLDADTDSGRQGRTAGHETGP